MNKHLFTFLFIVLTIKSVYAQRNNKFPTEAIYEEIPNNYDSYDAVILYQKKTVTIIADVSMGGLNTILTTHTKLKINTKNGILEHARIVVPKFDGQKMETMIARTIKKNGEVINLDTRDIKELNLSSSQNIHKKDNYLKFSLPGVEVNDEIEIITRYTGSGLITSGDLYLNSYLPCINSSYKLLLSQSLKTDITSYNNMPDPKIYVKDNFNVYEWALKDLPTYNDQEYSIQSYEAPFIRFAIRRYEVPEYNFTIEENSWTGFIESVLKATDSNISSWKSLNGFLETMVGKQDIASSPVNKVASLMKLHRFVCDSLIVEELPSDKSDRMLIYYVNKRKIDTRNLLLFYDKVFNYLNINYSVGFARNKYEGTFDDSFVASHLITNILLSFEIDGNYYFIVLKDGTISYEINEIPAELQGTKTVMIAIQDVKERVKQTQLLTTDKSNNVRRVKHILNVSLEQSKVAGNTKETYLGTVSSEYKCDYMGISEKELKEKIEKKYKNSNNSIKIDSAFYDNSLVAKFPYTFNLNYIYNFNEPSINLIDKNLFAISINNWMNHIIIRPSSAKRISNFHTNYLYTDNIKYYLVFDKKIELTNTEMLESKINNEFGSYSISVKQVDENSILIDSNYEINKNSLNKSYYYLIEDLFKAYEKANANQLIIKTLE